MIWVGSILTIKNSDIDKLKDNDILSIALFALYKMREIPEYSTLCELSYVVDKDSLLSLCEFFGGMTIKIPTIKELKIVLYAMSIYVQTQNCVCDCETALKDVPVQYRRDVRRAFYALTEVLKDYVIE